VARTLDLGILFKGNAGDLINTVNKVRSSLQSLKKDFEDLNKAAGQTGEGSDKASKGFDKAGKSSRKTGDDLNYQGKQIGKLSDSWYRLGAAMRVVLSYTIAGGLFYGVIEGAKKAVSEIINFDQALHNLMAISGATRGEVGAMGDIIKTLGSTTRYGAKEIADGMVYLAQAGFSAEESLVAIKDIAILSTATLEKFETTADLVTTTIRSFGLQASDTARVTDIFATAINKSKLDIDKLRVAFNYVGPFAHKAGMTLEETAASMMVLADAGVRQSTIGTGLRQVIARLAGPSEKLREIFSKYKVDMDKVNPATSSFVDIIKELEKVIPKAAESATGLGKAVQLFGLRGAPIISILTEIGSERYQEILNMTFKMGSAAEMAEIQLQGLGSMVKQLGDKMGVLAITIGEGGVSSAFRVLLGILRPLADAMIYIAGTAVGKFNIAMTGLTVTILALYAAFKFLALSFIAFNFGTTIIAANSAAKALGLLTLSADACTLAFRSLWATMLAHPIIAIAAGLAAVIVAIKTYADHTKQAALEAEKMIVKHNQVITTLEGYKDKLSKVEKGSAKYHSIVMALVKEYPQLASVMLDTNATIDDQRLAVNKLIEEYKKLKGLDLETVMRNMGKEIVAATTRMEGLQELIQKRGQVPTAVDVLPQTFEANEAQLNSWAAEAGKAKTELEALQMQAMELDREYTKLTGKKFDWSGVKLPEDLYKKIEQLNEIVKKHEKYMLSDEAKLQAQIEMLGQLGDAWVQYYNSVSGAEKVDVMEAAEKTNKAIDEMRSNAENQFLTESQIEAKRKDLVEDGLKTLMKSKQKEIKEVDRAEREKYNLKEAWLNIEYMRQAMELTENEQNWRKIADAELEVLTERLANRQRLTKELSEQRDSMTPDTYAKLMEDAVKGEFEAFKALYAKDKEVVKKNLDEKLAKEVDYSREHARITKLMFDNDLITRKQYDEYVKNMYLHRHQYDTEYYKQGKLSAKEYFDYLLELVKQEGEFSKEAKEQMATEFGTMTERIALGFDRAREKMKTWGETIVSISEQIGDKIADEAVGALDLFGDSADSMSERFANAARNILKWLAEMIIKQTLMNALMGGAGGGGGILGLITGALGMSGGLGYDPALGKTGFGITPYHHKGGILGKEATFQRAIPLSVFANAKRAHEGAILGKDEIPFIGKKGEGVFTEKQMEALGSFSQPTVNVKTEFKVDPNLKMKIKEGPTRQELQTTIKTIHLQALTEDEDYLNMNRSFIRGG